MLRHAYLIMAHSEYEQINLLLQMLDYEENDIYLHIDKKSPEPNKDELCRNIVYSNVYIYQEFKVYWGDFTQTACEVFLLEEAIKKSYDYYHLLSGSDLPLCSQKIIHAFFEKNNGKEFVRFWGPKLPEKYYSWIQLYHPFQKYLRISRNNKLNSFYQKIDFIFEKLQKFLKVNRLKNQNIPMQKGATWFSITHNFAVEVIDRKDWIYKVFKSTRSSDEIFIQTILLNSDYLQNRFEKTYEIDGLTGIRYIDWKRGKPYVFRKCDYQELINCNFLFARKFSIDIDRKLVEMLYNKVMHENKEQHF